MSALLILIGLLLGTAAPASLAAVSTLQWVMIGLTVAGDAQKGVKVAQELYVLSQNPAFRAMVAANGDVAIRLRPGITTINNIAY